MGSGKNVIDPCRRFGDWAVGEGYNVSSPRIAISSRLSRMLRFMFLRVLSLALLSTSVLAAAEPNSLAGDADAESVAAGHSYHGEAFNEGPRQAAELIPGMAKIEFPTSAKNETTQKFIEQGIAQLHGFWYLEAERSFRQAAKEEPELAIAYWGMAMANVNNSDRARGLTDEAMSRRDKNASRREKLYIEALDRFHPQPQKDGDDDKPADKQQRDAEREAKKKRAERYLRDLEQILHEFPDDLEARAMLALNLWTFERLGLKMTSRYATNALMSEVFAENPMHPAHHYRIHLWDSPRPQNALESAALCGPASPGIAHMWHMPGHIYSKLKRYSDAAWQQEASARVDHAHMNRARLIPDQIHNYAHNNEWLTRNLLYIGRVQDALEQSRNLVSLPRHPSYNTLAKRGSYKYGRQRLLQTLTQYGLWDELIKESGGHFLPPTDDTEAQEEWLGWLAVAHFMTGDADQGGKTLRSLRRRRLALHGESLDLAEAKANGADAKSEAAEEKADSGGQDGDEPSDEKEQSREEIKKHVDQLGVLIARAAAASASKRADKSAFEKHIEKAKVDQLIKAQWLADAGDLPGAIKIAEKSVKEGTGQVRPVAVLVDLLWRKGDKEAAGKRFEQLRKLAGEADIDTPLLAKLAPVAKAAGLEGDWRIAPQRASDLGERPPLDSLGPFRWQPYTAESWGANSAQGELIASEEFSGQPCILIFYLGFGCLHCVEQLHAFSPMIDQFREAGIEVVGISTETLEQLQLGIKNFDEDVTMSLLSDAENHVFKTFRCWDDFENQPLHGTFLIDARGQVRWQDISHEPFTDASFVLEESKRLLALPK
jgi:peroxiredoxin